MKSLQDYIDTFRDIATKLNFQGEAVEVLVQMLANASYISEVENIAYAQESSLEKATGINSKIQLCMDNMYSVFRGACPRVIIKIRPTSYKSFGMFDEIIAGNGFKVYYLGYYSPGSDSTGEIGTKTLQTIKDFVYSPITIAPALSDDDVYTIVGLLAKETVNKEWILNADNTYYVDCLENNLSNDMWVKIEGNYYEVTREFSDHILSGDIYDLTLPSFGSRLFISEIFRNTSLYTLGESGSSATPNTKITAKYFVFSSLSEYNKSTLSQQINLKGAKMVPFTTDFLGDYGFEEATTGVVLVDSTGRDELGTIHYKASRDRFVNSIIRSNSDIGVVLEEMYPDKIKTGGTNYEFNRLEDGSSIDIFYVPLNKNNPLTDTEIQRFIGSRSAYYITDSINIVAGTQYTIVATLDVEIYQNQGIDDEVSEIFQDYIGKFNVCLSQSIEEIRAQISKIDNVKQIKGLEFMYMSGDGSILNTEEIKELEEKELGRSYFTIETIINTVIN